MTEWANMRRRAFRIAKAIVGSEQDAEDIAQDACILIFQKKAQSLRFAVIDAIRTKHGRTGKRINAFRKALANGEHEFIIPVPFDETSLEFKKRVMGLKFVDRIISTLYFVHGFNMQEIANMGFVTEAFVSLKLKEIEKQLNGKSGLSKKFS